MPDQKQDDSDARSISTATSSSGDGAMTPTSSDLEGCSYTPAVPHPGKTYKIHLKDTDRVLTVTEGRAVVQPAGDGRLGGGWAWACAETANWLGFRNHVSGGFLGRRQDQSGIQAQNPYQSVDDCFCVRPHPDGGYLLLVSASAQTGGLQQVGLNPDGETLVGKQKDGALWLFEEV